jgi:periplasmic protein TonB
MDINKILSADILDIIFEGKNKQYGAYDLRKTYNKRLTKALLLTAAMALLIFLSTVFANAFKKNNADALDVLDTQMAEIKKDVPPKVLPDEEVKPEDKPEEIKDDQVISTKTVESDNKEAVVAAPVEDKGTQVAAVPQKDDDEGKIFTKVEVEAGFPGGDAAWGNFLRKNLNVEIPGENGAPEGNHTVVVRFIVSKDGSLSDIQCESDPGYGICQEAIRVIKKTKNWTPAIQNGRNVNAYRRQPITFQVVGQ